jgi:hypothetical protein
MTQQDYRNTIVFNTGDTKEIARFTEEGFYYKGEFVDDAGEVHRLLKEVLAQPVAEGPTNEELLAMRSWSCHGPTFDSDLVDFARAVLAKWGANAQ